MKIENAKYDKDPKTDENCCVNCVIDGEHWSVPLSENNRFYAEILKQVEEGKLSIAYAD